MGWPHVQVSLAKCICVPPPNNSTVLWTAFADHTWAVKPFTSKHLVPMMNTTVEEHLQRVIVSPNIVFKRDCAIYLSWLQGTVALGWAHTKQTPLSNAWGKDSKESHTVGRHYHTLRPSSPIYELYRASSPRAHIWLYPPHLLQHDSSLQKVQSSAPLIREILEGCQQIQNSTKTQTRKWCVSLSLLPLFSVILLKAILFFFFAR